MQYIWALTKICECSFRICCVFGKKVFLTQSLKKNKFSFHSFVVSTLSWALIDLLPGKSKQFLLLPCCATRGWACSAASWLWGLWVLLTLPAPDGDKENNHPSVAQPITHMHICWVGCVPFQHFPQAVFSHSKMLPKNTEIFLVVVYKSGCVAHFPGEQKWWVCVH